MSLYLQMSNVKNSIKAVENKLPDALLPLVIKHRAMLYGPAAG
jgi:hypothetical protein